MGYISSQVITLLAEYPTICFVRLVGWLNSRSERIRTSGSCFPKAVRSNSDYVKSTTYAHRSHAYVTDCDWTGVDTFRSHYGHVVPTTPFPRNVMCGYRIHTAERGNRLYIFTVHLIHVINYLIQKTTALDFSVTQNFTRQGVPI